MKRRTPALGLEPRTCRLTEVPSVLGALAAVAAVNPLCLHKG